MAKEKFPEGYLEFSHSARKALAYLYGNNPAVLNHIEDASQAISDAVVDGGVNVIWETFGGMYPYLKNLKKKTRKKILKLISRKYIGHILKNSCPKIEIDIGRKITE